MLGMAGFLGRLRDGDVEFVGQAEYRGVPIATVIGALGLLRMPDILIRMHASTKAGTLASALILVAVALVFGTTTVTHVGIADENVIDLTLDTGSLPDEAALEGLKAQLGHGGRLFAIVGETPVMEAVLVTRIDPDHFRRVSLFETSVAPLSNAPEPERFVF